MARQKAEKTTNLDENVLKTKTVLNRMFDLKCSRGIDGGVHCASIMFSYYEYLRENKHTKSKMFSNNSMRFVSEWRSFNNENTPATFEKYLLLSSIFNCDFRDIVFVLGHERQQRCFDFRLDLLPVEKRGSVETFCIKMPLIRAGMRRCASGMEDCFRGGTSEKDRFNRRTILDDVLNGKELSSEEAVAATQAVKVVLDAYYAQRPPVSVKELLRFESVTGRDVVCDLYGASYVDIEFAVDREQASERRGKKCGKATLDALCASEEQLKQIREYLLKNSCSVERVYSDYLISGKDGKYGIILIDNGIKTAKPLYDYIHRAGGVTYCIKGDAVYNMEFDLTRGDANIAYRAGAHKAHAELAERLTLLGRLILNRGFRYFKANGGLIVMFPDQTAVFAQMDNDSIIVRKNGRPFYGLKTPSGAIIPPIYDRKIECGEGIFTACMNGKYGFLDLSGATLVDYKFDSASVFSEGLAAVSKNGKYGYIDKSGRVVIDFAFDYACDFGSGLACVTINGKDGYINKSGKVVISPQFDNGFKFCDGVAAVESNGKYGYIDSNGKVLRPMIYDAATSAKDGYARVISMGNLISIKLGA